MAASDTHPFQAGNPNADHFVSVLLSTI